MTSVSVLKMRIKRAESKLQGLNYDWELCNEILQKLKKALRLEADVMRKIQLQEQVEEKENELNTLTEDIEEKENELNQLEQQLKIIENGDNSNKQQDKEQTKQMLEFSLLHMDFLKQLDIFREFINSNRNIYGFLIHGSINYGHIWLLKRLLQEIPNQTVPVIEYQLVDCVSTGGFKKLWRILAKKVNLPPKTPPELIVRGVSEQLKTNNIILVFRQIDYLGEALFNDLIEEFWEPLVNGIEIENNSTQNKQLFMFLIDFKGEVTTWNINLAEQIDQNWQSHILIQLQIEPIEEKILSLWIDSYSSSFIKSNLYKTDDLKQLIFEKTEGIPGMVLQEIYELCQYDWDDEVEKWQTI